MPSSLAMMIEWCMLSFKRFCTPAAEIIRLPLHDLPDRMTKRFIHNLCLTGFFANQAVLNVRSISTGFALSGLG